MVWACPSWALDFQDMVLHSMAGSMVSSMYVENYVKHWCTYINKGGAASGPPLAGMSRNDLHNALHAADHAAGQAVGHAVQNHVLKDL